MSERTRHRLAFIILCVVLMATAVFILGESVYESQKQTVLTAPVAEPASGSTLASQVSGFQRADRALDDQRAPQGVASNRTLGTFYSRRAYPGAPPIIPHAVADERDLGGARCLTCHENGGYAPQFEAFTPVVPHPEYANCRQCHVPMRSPNLFRGTQWQRIDPPALGQSALPGSPPPIPHTIQLRENCLACHAGPGAVPELRVSHPERVNCRQCHAAIRDDAPWTRTPSPIRAVPKDGEVNP